MRHDELEKEEDRSRDLIDALGMLSRETQATPDLIARTLAQADQLPEPRRAWRHWVGIAAWSVPMHSPAMVVSLLVLALVGAVPQYLTWVRAYVMGVPSETVHEARVQEELWEKNFACATQLDHDSGNYAAITGEHVVVVAWACPSGDVLVTIEATTADATRRTVWIPLDSGHASMAMLDHLVRTAFATPYPRTAKRRATPMVNVLCQKWLPDRSILRRVQLANGQCFDEVINPRTGAVIKRRPASCDRQC